MGSFIVRRILWSIPAVFMLMTILFLLSNASPRDAIDIGLWHQGIDDKNTPNFDLLYNEEYMDQMKDRPDYYFSILPSFYPKTTNSIINPVDRTRVKKLLSLGYANAEIDQFNDLIKGLKTDTTITSFAIDDLSPKQLLGSNFYERLTKDQKFTLSKIIANQNTFYTPRFQWNGFDNQFHNWLSNALRGDWGYSYTDGSPIIDKVVRALKWTSTLFVINLFLLILIGFPLVYLAIYKENLLSKLIEGFSVFFYIIPLFWLATLVQVFLTTPDYGMQIFKAYQEDYSNSYTFLERIGSFLTRYFPAVICLVLTDLAVLIRYLKANIIKEKTQPYVSTAISKGASNNLVVLRHIIPNALTPIITVLVGSLPLFLVGSLIVEVIFNIPGMGRLLFNSIQITDWPVVYFVTLLTGIATTIFYLFGDLLYAYFDPKIEYD